MAAAAGTGAPRPPAATAAKQPPARPLLSAGSLRSQPSQRLDLHAAATLARQLSGNIPPLRGLSSTFGSKDTRRNPSHIDPSTTLSEFVERLDVDAFVSELDIPFTADTPESSLYISPPGGGSIAHGSGIVELQLSTGGATPPPLPIPAIRVNSVDSVRDIVVALPDGAAGPRTDVASPEEVALTSLYVSRPPVLTALRVRSPRSLTAPHARPAGGAGGAPKPGAKRAPPTPQDGCLEDTGGAVPSLWSPKILGPPDGRVRSLSVPLFSGAASSASTLPPAGLDVGCGGGGVQEGPPRPKLLRKKQPPRSAATHDAGEPGVPDEHPTKDARPAPAQRPSGPVVRAATAEAFSSTFGTIGAGDVDDVPRPGYSGGGASAQSMQSVFVGAGGEGNLARPRPPMHRIMTGSAALLDSLPSVPSMDDISAPGSPVGSALTTGLSPVGRRRARLSSQHNAPPSNGVIRISVPRPAAAVTTPPETPLTHDANSTADEDPRPMFAPIVKTLCRAYGLTCGEAMTLVGETGVPSEAWVRVYSIEVKEGDSPPAGLTRRTSVMSARGAPLTQVRVDPREDVFVVLATEESRGVVGSFNSEFLFNTTQARQQKPGLGHRRSSMQATHQPVAPAGQVHDGLFIYRRRDRGGRHNEGAPRDANVVGGGKDAPPRAGHPMKESKEEKDNGVYTTGDRIHIGDHDLFLNLRNRTASSQLCTFGDPSLSSILGHVKNGCERIKRLHVFSTGPALPVPAGESTPVGGTTSKSAGAHAPTTASRTAAGGVASPPVRKTSMRRVSPGAGAPGARRASVGTTPVKAGRGEVKTARAGAAGKGVPSTRAAQLRAEKGREREVEKEKEPPRRTSRANVVYGPPRSARLTSPSAATPVRRRSPLRDTAASRARHTTPPRAADARAYTRHAVSPPRILTFSPRQTKAKTATQAPPAPPPMRLRGS